MENKFQWRLILGQQSLSWQNQVISSDPLQQSVVNLCTYSGEKIQVKGEAMCNTEYKGKHYVLPIVVISGNGPTLLGRSWLQHIPLNWPNLFQAILKVDDKLSQLLQSFSDVFKEELGALQGEKVNIHIDPSVPPKFCKAWSLPYAMREKVEKELQCLEDQGIITPVKYSKWAAPIVPYKLTANRASRLEHIPFLKLTIYSVNQYTGWWYLVYKAGREPSLFTARTR